MDGENGSKPYEQMDDLGVSHSFGSTPIYTLSLRWPPRSQPGGGGSWMLGRQTVTEMTGPKFALNRNGEGARMVRTATMAPRGWDV